MGSPFLPFPSLAPCPLIAAPLRARRAGFTLIELLVVIAIIAILSALLFPLLGKALKSGKQATSVSNLRQWGGAFHSCWQDHDGDMPADGSGATAESEEAWFNQMPKKVGLTAMKETATVDLPRFGAKSLWVNPGAPSIAVSGVPFFYGYNDYLSTTDEPTMKLTRVAHPSKTALMVEKFPDVSPVGNPETIRSFYGGAKEQTDLDALCNVLFVDGHVTAVTRKVFTDALSSTASNEDELLQAPFLWLPFVGAHP